MTRYDRMAMSLHWLIAMLLISNMLLGLWMVEAIEHSSSRALATEVFQWHKSLGLAVLLLSLLRLGWRLSHRPPPLPPAMPNWERWTARVTHIAFYLLMLGLPLSGWLYVSTQWRGEAPLTVPTLWFGLFEVPHLAPLHQLNDAARMRWAAGLHSSHEWLANITAVLLLLHVGAALKHRYINHDEILQRMWPARAGRWLTALVLLLALTIAALLLRPAASPPSAMISSSGWQLDPQRSWIRFSGEHAGSRFSGQFSHWQAELLIDAEQPQRSRIAARIATASASDGVRLHDETLPQQEWFDVARHPWAHFSSQRIEAADNALWLIHGELQIKQHRHAVAPLELRFENGQALIKADLQVDRADYNLGMSSDPSGDWVSREIGISIELVATPP